MKVRWMDNSLRLRITPAEMQTLETGGTITEAAVFPAGWEIVVAPGKRTSLDSPRRGKAVLTLSTDDLADLAQPDTEGVYFESAGYRYFVEKDYPCVHPRPDTAQESTETFAPPPGFAERPHTP